MIPRNIATQGFSATSFRSLSIATQGFLPTAYAPQDFSAGASGSTRRKRRDYRLEARLEELDEVLRRYEARAFAAAPGSLALPAAVAAFSGARVDSMAMQRAAELIGAIGRGAARVEDVRALRELLGEARRQATEAEARRVRNRWRAVVLTAILVLL